MTPSSATTHKLPDLPYPNDALAPFLSAETLEIHHGRHHAAYVEKLNGLVDGTELESLDLVELVRRAEGGTFNNAGQHFNHSFYWRSIAAGGGKQPSGELKKAIEGSFGSLDTLRDAFVTAATGLFGSGWTWLVKDPKGEVAIRTTQNAGCPLTDGETPLVTCDVWEHAYYVDYRNKRPDYVKAFWKAIDWDFAGRCYSSPDGILAEIL